MAFANYNHQLTALHLAILRRESKPPLAKTERPRRRSLPVGFLSFTQPKPADALGTTKPPSNLSSSVDNLGTDPFRESYSALSSQCKIDTNNWRDAEPVQAGVGEGRSFPSMSPAGAHHVSRAGECDRTENSQSTLARAEVDMKVESQVHPQQEKHSVNTSRSATGARSFLPDEWSKVSRLPPSFVPPSAFVRVIHSALRTHTC
jgi:hypothetical protein